ncbi:MAG: MFS transporter [Pseudohongiellaceae bacterium]
MPRKLHRNIIAIYGLAFFHSFLVIVPVLVPFFASKGLSLAEIFYLQAIYATTIVVLEAPSGFFADFFGRRAALLIGSMIHGLGYFILNFSDSLTTLVVFEVTLGAATSLLSGADLALLYDTQKALADEENKEHSNGIANLGFIRSTAEGFGALLGGSLAMISFDLMVLIQSLSAWMCLLLALVLVEPPVDQNDAHSRNLKLGGILRHMLVGDPLLRKLVLAIPLYNLMTFHVAWLIQPFWESQGMPLALFGGLWCMQSITTAIANKLGFRVERKHGAVFALCLIGVLPIVSYFGLAWLQGWYGIGIGLLLFVCRGLNQVILVNALNRRVPSSFRATANSLTSFLFRLSFIVTGPLIGMIAQSSGLESAMLILGGASIAVFIFVMMPLANAVKRTQRQLSH